VGVSSARSEEGQRACRDNAKEHKTCGIACCAVAMVFSVVCGSIVIVADAIVDALQDRRSEQNITKEVILRYDRQKCRERRSFGCGCGGAACVLSPVVRH
jgi:hypothetical protein